MIGAVEEALEENNDHLDQILGLLKKKEVPCVNTLEWEDAACPFSKPVVVV